VRTTLPADVLLPSVRRLASSLDGQVAVHDLRAFDAALAAGVAGPQLLVLLMGSFAVIALVLTAMGLFGLVAHGVQRRTREIGVRMALGAGRTTIVTMVTREALALVAAGLAVGGAGALAADAALGSRLAGAGPPMPAVLAAAGAVVLITAILSAAVPARRAAGVDPTDALRID
jgi:ABC-type antimicrobial peptide transport system permease subunit